MATLKQLKKVAEEFNEVGFINEKIDTTLPEKKLVAILKEAIDCIDPELDHFTDDTKAIVNEVAGKVIFTDQEEQEEVAEKIHKQNIADKPVQTDNDDEDANDDTPDDPELLTPSGRKQVPIPVKKEKKEKAVKEEKKELFAKKASTTADRVAFISPFIEKGKSTKAQLVEKLTAKFPDLAVSSLQTLLTDAKNPKYNKFAKLVVQDDKGVLSFKEE